MKKKLLSLTMALSIMATMSTSVFASEPVSNVSSEISILSQNADTMDYNEFVAYTENVDELLKDMTPTTSESYYDYDEQCLVTYNTYVVDDVNNNARAFTSKYLYGETIKTWAGGTTTTAKVAGYFTSSGGNISVSSPRGWYETTSTTSGTKVVYQSSVSVKTGSFFGVNYIELGYNIISENTIGVQTNISTSLRVNAEV